MSSQARNSEPWRDAAVKQEQVFFLRDSSEPATATPCAGAVAPAASACPAASISVVQAAATQLDDAEPPSAYDDRNQEMQVAETAQTDRSNGLAYLDAAVTRFLADKAAIGKNNDSRTNVAKLYADAHRLFADARRPPQDSPQMWAKYDESADTANKAAAEHWKLYGERDTPFRPGKFVDRGPRRLPPTTLEIYHWLFNLDKEEENLSKIEEFWNRRV